jgi:hypothetical protein
MSISAAQCFVGVLLFVEQLLIFAIEKANGLKPQLSAQATGILGGMFKGLLQNYGQDQQIVDDVAGTLKVILNLVGAEHVVQATGQILSEVSGMNEMQASAFMSKYQK